MKKQWNAIFLLAGTAIGSGMLSLPIVLSHVGVLYTCLLMGLFAAVSYFSAIIRVELNLQSNCEYTLEDVGLAFSGKIAALVGSVCLKILSLALLAAYTYGLSAMAPISNTVVTAAIGIGIFLLLVFSSERIVNSNRTLFIFLLLAVLLAIVHMLISVDFNGLPTVAHDIRPAKVCVVLPTLFTSFGFQGSLHSLTKFCGDDVRMLKRSCLWGSVIPAIVYLSWTFCVMAIVFNHQPELFTRMTRSGVDVGELITALGAAADAVFVKRAVVVISTLAIVTSVVGVGVALVEDLEMAFDRWEIPLVRGRRRRVLASLLAVMPSVFVAIVVPEAFIKTLGFAGMILAVLAIFLPSFLLLKIAKPLKIEILSRRSIVCATVAVGVLLVVCEMVSIFGS
ncbi:MAG: hypothetical protein LBB63_03745 [Holosporaceae bacterium]|nr:hypothetical protein [Holosporaceae bacterium]